MELNEQSFYRFSGTPSRRVIPMLATEQGIVLDFEQANEAKEKAFLNSIHLLKPIDPVVRIAAQPIPPPHSPPLVDAMIPDVNQVVDAVMRLAEGGKLS